MATKKTVEPTTWETVKTFVTDHKLWFIAGAVVLIALWVL